MSAPSGAVDYMWMFPGGVFESTRCPHLSPSGRRCECPIDHPFNHRTYTEPRVEWSEPRLACTAPSVIEIEGMLR